MSFVIGINPNHISQRMFFIGDDTMLCERVDLIAIAKTGFIKLLFTTQPLKSRMTHPFIFGGQDVS